MKQASATYNEKLTYKGLLNKCDAEYFANMGEIKRAPRELHLAERVASQTEGVLQAKIDELENESRAISRLNELLSMAKRDVESKINDFQHDAGILQGRLSRVEEHADADAKYKDAEISELNEQKTALTYETSELVERASAEVKFMDAKISKLQEDNSVLTREFNDLGANAFKEVESRNAKIIKLEKDNTALAEKTRADAEAAKKSRDTDVSKLQEDKSGLANEISIFREKAALDEQASLAKTTKLEKENGKLHEQVLSLRKELEAAKKAKETAARPNPFLSPAPLSTPTPATLFAPSGSLFSRVRHPQLNSYPTPPASIDRDSPVSIGANAVGGKRPLFDKSLASVLMTPAPAQQHKTAFTPPPQQASLFSSAGRAAQEHVGEPYASSSEAQMIPVDDYDNENDGELMDRDEDMGEGGPTTTIATVRPITGMMGNYPVVRPVFDVPVEMADAGAPEEGQVTEEGLDGVLKEGLHPAAKSSGLKARLQKPQITEEGLDGVLKEELHPVTKSPGPSNPRVNRQTAGGSGGRTRGNGAIGKPVQSNTAKSRSSTSDRPSKLFGHQSAGTHVAGRRQQQPRDGRSARSGEAPSRGGKQTARGGGRQLQATTAAANVGVAQAALMMQRAIERAEDNDDAPRELEAQSTRSSRYAGRQSQIQENADNEDGVDYSTAKYGPQPEDDSFYAQVSRDAMLRWTGKNNPEGDKNSYHAPRELEEQKRLSKDKSRIARS